MTRPFSLFVPIAVVLLAVLAALPGPAAGATTKSTTKSTASSSRTKSKRAAAKPAPPASAAAVDSLRLQLKGTEDALREQEQKAKSRDADLDSLRRQIGALEEQLRSTNRRLEEVTEELPPAQRDSAFEARLKNVERTSQRSAELPPDVVSAGDFPGSIRIPKTDAAIKFGGLIRVSVVATMDPLGTDDRFLTNSIPVGDTVAAGSDQRVNISARTSRFNVEFRTPSGLGQVRAFMEGDFAGSQNTFRLRHAYAQYRVLLLGQTWSTFGDPMLNYEDLDFEGVSSENNTRQPQVRYRPSGEMKLRPALAIEQPTTSVEGGQSVNTTPDLVARLTWKYSKDRHLQWAGVLRGIRAQPNDDPSQVGKATGWGLSASGIVPSFFHPSKDRILFQVTGGEGVARYINDLNSLGGQDAVFNPATGELEALPVFGWFAAYEHHWFSIKTLEQSRFRTTLIWSEVVVDNRDYQAADAYHSSERFSVNLVFSPEPRMDAGFEYIYGKRVNKDGQEGSSSQFQAVVKFFF